MRKFYVAYSYMGLNFTYDSPCWSVIVFENKNIRKKWMDKNAYKDGRAVAEICNYNTAKKIAPDFFKTKSYSHRITFSMLEDL